MATPPSPLSMKQKLGLVVASSAPGRFLIGSKIGAGRVTTVASSGARFGMTMMWPLLLSCVFTYVMIVVFGRYTAITGQTALYSYKNHFGNAIAMFVLVSLLTSEWVSSMGVMGVVVQVVQEWSRPFTASGNGFHPILLVTIFATLLYALFLIGSHRFFEKILALFVAIMGLSFFLTMFMVIPDPAEVIRGLIPRLPNEEHALLIMASMVGTTMGAILFVVRSILVQEKGWKADDLKEEKRDALISVIMMFVLSTAVMACAAGTLHLMGKNVDNAIDMVKLLEPLAGRFAISIFVAGIVSAGLSSLFPIILLAPWLIADYRGTKRNMKSTSSRLLVLWGVLLGFTIPVFGGRPVLIMVASQALCIMATPVAIGLMMILHNRESLMGKHKATTGLNIWMWIILLFTIGMTVAGLIGLANLL